MSDTVAVIVGLGLVVVLVALGAAEAALTSISRARAQSLDSDAPDRPSALTDLVHDRVRTVAPILLLALTAQFTLASIVAVAVQRRWGAGWIPLAVLVQVTVLFVLAELFPKIWAVRNIDQAAPAAAVASRALLALFPLRWLVGLLVGASRPLLGRGPRRPPPIASEEEFVAIAGAAVAAELIEDTEGEIIASILHFGDTIVREAMVPRPDVLAVSADTTIDQAIHMLGERGVSRMPVYGDDIDDVTGIVHVKDLFARVQRGRGSHYVSIAQRKPYFVPETKKAAELLAELKEIPDNMVIVVDEHGGTAGIVTLEDLIEEIIGEMVDEFDTAEEPLLEPLRGGEWRVHGRMPVDEFNALVGAHMPDDRWDTVGGLIFGALGRVPEVGDSVVESGHRLTVEQVDGRRITRVRVQDADAPVDDRTGGPDDDLAADIAGE